MAGEKHHRRGLGEVFAARHVRSDALRRTGLADAGQAMARGRIVIDPFLQPLDVASDDVTLGGVARAAGRRRLERDGDRSALHPLLHAGGTSQDRRELVDGDRLRRVATPRAARVEHVRAKRPQHRAAERSMVSTAGVALDGRRRRRGRRRRARAAARERPSATRTARPWWWRGRSRPAGSSAGACPSRWRGDREGDRSVRAAPARPCDRSSPRTKTTRRSPRARGRRASSNRRRRSAGHRPWAGLLRLAARRVVAGDERAASPIDDEMRRAPDADRRSRSCPCASSRSGPSSWESRCLPVSPAPSSRRSSVSSPCRAAADRPAALPSRSLMRFRMWSCNGAVSRREVSAVDLGRAREVRLFCGRGLTRVHSSSWPQLLLTTESTNDSESR